MATAAKSKSKSKSTAKKSPAKKKPAARKAPAKKKLTEKVQPGFAPGTEIQVHPAHVVEVEASRRRRPIPKAVQKTKVTKDGSVNLSVEKPGIYAIAGRIDEKADTWRYVKVPVRG